MQEHRNMKDMRGARWFIGGILSVCSLIIVGIGVLILYPYFYQGRIYPGVSIADVAVGGLTEAEARRRVEARIEAYRNQGVRVQGFGKEVTILPTVRALGDPDLTYDIVTYDVDASVRNAYRAGREQNQLAAVRTFVTIGWRLTPLNLPMVYQYDQVKLAEEIQEAFGAYETPALNARIRALSPQDVWVERESGGQQIDWDGALAQLRKVLSYVRSGPVELTLKAVEPQVRAADIMPLLPRVRDILQRAPFTLLVERQYLERAEKLLRVPQNEESADEWRIDPRGEYYQKEIPLEEIRNWFEARREGAGVITLGFRTWDVEAWLKDVRDRLDVPAVDAKFEVKDGKVVAFQSSQDGQTLDVAATQQSLEAALIAQGERSTRAVIRTVTAERQIQDVNALGIRERLGVGTSNFAGSPTNRRHNIQVGVDAVNGTLIAPGSEFSLLQTLGEIDAAAGYLPELVIKGNRTVPEYGGGLCQIGTTAFRAALSAGLPITERRNHSFRVRYYEPAGMDATIYIPKPDFRFLNDTGNYLLFQARTEGDEVIFELWGTSDGRLATTTKPKIFNIVRPSPAKIIATADLKPGEKKCTEKPQSGADAVFTYTVVYPNGETKEQEFKSHYRPWQEVCLVGVAKNQEGGTSNNKDTMLPSQDAAGLQGE